MTTQVAVSNEDIEESVAAGQPLCIPRGANHGFVNNGNQNAEVLCGITSAATRVQDFGQPIDLFNTEFGGELARF
jgi:quercetin dioxygenase-like cupin family protein